MLLATSRTVRLGGAGMVLPPDTAAVVREPEPSSQYHLKVYPTPFSSRVSVMCDRTSPIPDPLEAV